MSESGGAPTVGSVDDLQRTLQILQGQIDNLEGELAAERKAREQLESRVEAYEELVEFRGDEDSPKIEDIHVAGLPVGTILTSKAPKSDVEDIEERLEVVENDPGAKADPEYTLPIQQVTDTWKAGAGNLKANERRAAIVWSKFFDVAGKGPLGYTLSSSDVSTILAAKDESTHTETVRRTMDMVADLGKDYIEVERVRGQNHLVIEHGDWREFVENLQDSIPHE